MRTDDLIDALAADAGPDPVGGPRRRLAGLTLAAAALALVGVLAWLKIRPDLMQVMGGGFFWLKAAYTAVVGLAGYLMIERLARPLGSPRLGLILGGVIMAVFVLAGLVQFGVSADRIAMLRGQSWSRCSLNILALGGPATLLGLWIVRGLAPVRPGLAGAAVGALAGGVAATVYGLHCAESTFVFVGVWYSLGILACAVLGGLAGRWALRW